MSFHRARWPVLLALWAIGRFVAGGPAMAQDTSAAGYDGVYEGMLGGAAVVAEFQGNTGRYFYASKGVDLALQIKPKGSSLEIVERAESDPPKLAATGLLRGLKGNRFTGTWSDPKGGHTVPVSLSRFFAGRIPPSDGSVRAIDATSAPYEWRWVQLRVGYSEGPEVAVGDLAYRLVKDDAFGLRYPRLTRFPDASRMAGANRVLAHIHVNSIVWMRDNANGARESIASRDQKRVNDVIGAGMNEQDSIAVTALTKTALSFVEKGFWDGGGVHPNEYLTGHTIDLAMGAEVAGALVSADQPARFGNSLDLTEPEKRRAFDGLWLGKLRASLGRAPGASKAPNSAPTDDTDGCIAGIQDENFLSSGGSEYELYLKDGGLAVHPVGWPHAAAICFTEFSKVPVVLTAAELKPFLTPGETLITGK